MLERAKSCRKKTTANVFESRFIYLAYEKVMTSQLVHKPPNWISQDTVPQPHPSYFVQPCTTTSAPSIA